MSTNSKKSEQLGMPFGTASAKLRKSILFRLLEETGKNICFQCGRKIESEAELSIEHKIPWLDSDNPVNLFFNLDNIALSHLTCNVSAARKSQEAKRASHIKRVLEGKHPNTKLNVENILEIKEALKIYSRKEVCRMFNLSKTGLAMIARGETFSYIK